MWSSFAASVPTVGMAGTANHTGYWLAQSDGAVVNKGNANFLGSPKASGVHLNQSIVDIENFPSNQGYWLLGGDGGVFAYGASKYHGHPPANSTTHYYVAIISTPSGAGYWVVSKLGTTYSFGDATTTYKVDFTKKNYAVAYGTISGATKIVGADRTSDGKGLFILDSTGKLYVVGDAYDYGSVALHSGETAVGVGANTIKSVLITTSKGRVIPKGSFAANKGDLSATALNSPIVGIEKFGSTLDGSLGYWLVGYDGGVFNFGKAGFYGSTGNVAPPSPTTSPTGTTTTSPTGTHTTPTGTTGGATTVYNGTLDQCKAKTVRAPGTGSCVSTIQFLLFTHGQTYGRDALGIFGTGTTAGVTDFQRFSGIAQDGVVGPQTWGKLTTTSNIDPPPISASSPACLEAISYNNTLRSDTLTTYAYIDALTRASQHLGWNGQPNRATVEGLTGSLIFYNNLLLAKASLIQASYGAPATGCSHDPASVMSTVRYYYSTGVSYYSSIRTELSNWSYAVDHRYGPPSP